MYQHPQSLDINASYQRDEALKAAEQRRLLRSGEAEADPRKARGVAALAREIESELASLGGLAAAIVRSRRHRPAL